MSRRRPLAILACAVALLAGALAAAPAQAEFGIKEFDLALSDGEGGVDFQAGAHPYSVTSSFQVNTFKFGPTIEDFVPEGGGVKDLITDLPPGLVGDGTYPRCSVVDFANVEGGTLGARPLCPDSTAVGVAAADLFVPRPFIWGAGAVFNLAPPPGVTARVGFIVSGQPITLDIGVEQGGDHSLVAKLNNVPQGVIVFGGLLELWGVPADAAHDQVRGGCFSKPLNFGDIDFDPETSPASKGSCPAGIEERPFLTMPTACDGPQEASYEASSWEDPDTYVTGAATTHDNAEPPNPQGFTGCGKLGYAPEIESIPTSDSAESGTGLDFDVAFNDEGLANPDGLVQSTTKKAEVTLPDGITINPSVGEGLGVCTPADIERETLAAQTGEGCPNSSKIGTLHLETPLVADDIEGSVFLAQQDDPKTTEPGAENPFDSLIAMYLVLKNKDLGINVRLPAEVEPDPVTGRLVTTLDDLPQLPFSSFNFHFKEGQRAPLITPATCGVYTTEAKFYPWSDPDNPRTLSSDFRVTRGVGGGECPPGGVRPFNPGFEAGSINNAAGAFSPFNMRLTRADGEQDLTKFSSQLPPGVLGSLAGVAKCPDAAVGVAKAKSGRDELASPSCPANSQIGSTKAGAGVGSALTYVGGRLYLAGPYKGAPLSVISITPAVAGPFDAGTVVVRLGLDLNPKSAEVQVDGAASDPIPHILKGIVLKVRDLRVYVDRPAFTLNPTSCDESAARATLFGSYVNVLDPADDRPVGLSSRYQAASCQALGFSPRLGMRLRGRATKRGGHPGLRAVYSPRRGDANVEGLVVRLPRSAFLDQAHIRTICTRVQFAADNCPKGARYGYIRAWTPLLDEPLQGPVWLRSSNHKLPDLVFDLRGLVDVEVQTRIDSVRGGIRARVENAPDAPISRVILNMQGGKKGLIVNSRNLCTKRKGRANVKGTGQNGKQFTRRPVLRSQCAKKRRKAKRSSHSR